ncbi:MAG: hypothetical protein ACREJB_03380 [Planctomycetaceae bacterium]
MRRHLGKVALTVSFGLTALLAGSSTSQAQYYDTWTSLFGPSWYSSYYYGPTYATAYYPSYYPSYYSSYYRVGYGSACCPTATYYAPSLSCCPTARYYAPSCCPTSCCPTSCCPTNCCPTGCATGDCGLSYATPSRGSDGFQPTPIERDLPRTFENESVPSTPDGGGLPPNQEDFGAPPDSGTEDQLNQRNGEYGANYPPSTLRGRKNGPATRQPAVDENDAAPSNNGPIIRTLNLDDRNVVWRAAAEPARMTVRSRLLSLETARARQKSNDQWTPVSTRVAGK